MTTNSVPEIGGQAISNTDGWLGGTPDSPSKKWTRPESNETKSPRQSARSETNDWLGYSPGRGPSSPSSKRPGQVKIEGLKRSIKDNPFLKNEL